MVKDTHTDLHAKTTGPKSKMLKPLKILLRPSIESTSFQETGHCIRASDDILWQKALGAFISINYMDLLSFLNDWGWQKQENSSCSAYIAQSNSKVMLAGTRVCKAK